ncbi:hypothetical protein N007_10785 [Alicyclobacillus acidoterrestris ATCC 49025]|nr:hypothetical protein N007_10785 [Alicyclobacillus acidoterrestris ATCC 49025]
MFKLLPNFLVIGAAKAGTTALYRYLSQHPEVFMPSIKEPNYFALANREVRFQGPGDDRTNRSSITRFADYQALFDEADGYQAVGEASPMYLYTADAANRIHDLIPNVKLIVILRDPVERAHSAYLHLRRDEREPLANFADAIAAEEERIAKHWAPMWHLRGVVSTSNSCNRTSMCFPEHRCCFSAMRISIGIQSQSVDAYSIF